MKLQIITLGCSKNRVDSEHILARAAACGVEIVSENASFEDARPDIVALNTCGFIQDAKTESIEAIFSALEAKKRGFVGKVLVFGCLSQRYRKELQEEIPEVDGFLGSFDAENLLAAMGLKNDDGLYYRRLLTTPPHYAYLKISEGCNRTCSYCAIPAIRGAHISVPMEKLVREAEELAGLGVKELIVVAQDTTYYGLDLYKKRMLAPLLAKLA
ncbi:MAG: radical SAM protein, partial [Bacteroidales bacterium]|nr:radical SAM protein [Bacteroidales bacterium]